MDNSKLAKNSILYLMSMVIPRTFGFIVLPIFTRFIVPEEYAIFYLTSSVIGVMAVLSTMGLNAFYLRNYAIEKDKKEINGTIFWSMTIWNIFIFLIALIVMPFILKWTQMSFPFYPFMFLALVTQLFSSMEIIPMRTFRIRGEAKQYFIRILLKTILGFGLGLLFVVEMKLGVLGKYYGDLITATVFAVIFILYMIKNSYLKINIPLLKRALRFSLPIVPADVVSTSTPMVINVIIERTLSLAQLGIYSIGVTISSVIQLVTSSISLTIEPELYIRAVKEDYPLFFRKMKNLTVVAVSILCVGAGLFVREATFLLLQEKYWDSWRIVQIISISYIVQCLKDSYSQLVIIQGHTSKLIWSNAGFLVTNVLVCILALPRWGENALGWSTIIGLLVSFCILYLSVDRTKYANMNLKRDFFVMGFAAMTLLFSRITHTQTIWISVGIKLVIYGAYIFIIMILYKIYPKQILNELIKRKKITSENIQG